MPTHALNAELHGGRLDVVVQNSRVTIGASRFGASEHPRVIMFLLGLPRLESLTQLGVYRDFVARCISLGHTLDLSMREHLADRQSAIIEIEIVPLQRKRFAHAEAETPANEHHEVVSLGKRLDQRL